VARGERRRFGAAFGAASRFPLILCCAFAGLRPVTRRLTWLSLTGRPQPRTAAGGLCSTANLRPQGPVGVTLRPPFYRPYVSSHQHRTRPTADPPYKRKDAPGSPPRNARNQRTTRSLDTSPATPPPEQHPQLASGHLWASQALPAAPEFRRDFVRARPRGEQRKQHQLTTVGSMR
jgi:hypothetical protein